MKAREITAWACSKVCCHQIHRSQAEADACCVCVKCGGEASGRGDWCLSCRMEPDLERAREDLKYAQERLDRLEKSAAEVRARPPRGVRP